jgi:chorismate synthase
MYNRFGRGFRLEIEGASHSETIRITLEGVPQGIALAEEDFERDLAQRRAGAIGTTPRTESDKPQIEGLAEGVTTGERITITFHNSNTRSGDYSHLRRHPRPSHVDFVANSRWGEAVDLRGSGQFSGRMTVALVAAGVVAKKIVGFGVEFSSEIIELGGERDRNRFEEVLLDAVADGDSIGGVVECRVKGLPIGLGEPFFDSAESVISHLLFSVPAVKGVEFGSGFEGVRLRGSERNDRIIAADGTTATNNEGGINGGLTNGNELVVRAAIKPTPSISQPQDTFNFESGKIEPLIIGGRHDCCIALRARIVVEAVVAIALAELKLAAR